MSDEEIKRFERGSIHRLRYLLSVVKQQNLSVIGVNQ